RHVGSPDGWYGGGRGQPSADLEPLCIHHWGGGGIVGRGGVVDLGADGGGAGGGYDPFSRVTFRPDDLSAALQAQGVALRGGDILCVRTGWTDKYLTLDPAARAELADGMQEVSGSA